MANIITSYAREDRPLADKIAAAMKERGLNVFWDLTIPPGNTWRETLKAELDAADHVISTLIGTYAGFGFEERQMFFNADKIDPKTTATNTIVLSLAAVAANTWALSILPAKQ